MSKESNRANSDSGILSTGIRDDGSLSISHNRLTELMFGNSVALCQIADNRPTMWGLGLDKPPLDWCDALTLQMMLVV